MNDLGRWKIEQVTRFLDCNCSVSQEERPPPPPPTLLFYSCRKTREAAPVQKPACWFQWFLHICGLFFFRALTTTWIPRFYRLMTGGVCAAVPIAPVSDFCACGLEERFMEEEVDRVERNGDGVQKRAGLRGRRIHR